MNRVITYRGEEWEVSPVRGLDKFPSDQLHDIVGGFYDMVELRNGQIMVFNANAIWDDMPYNEKATKYMELSDPDWEYVAGNVLICDSDMVDLIN